LRQIKKDINEVLNLKHLFLILITFMLFIPGAVSANEAVDDTMVIFLQEINSASNPTEIGFIIEKYAGDIGLDLEQYHRLNNNLNTLKMLVGNQYSSVSEFVNSFEQAVTKTVQSGSSSSGSGGSHTVIISKQYSCNISGTLSLPQGEVAPEDGYEFDLYFNDGFEPKHTIVTIPKGANNVEYSCSYLIWSGQSNIRGRLTLSGDADAKYQTCTYTEALPLTEEINDLTVNMQIPYAQRKLGGVFRLPDNMEVLGDDLPVAIYITKDGFKFDINKTLVAGAREVEFLVGVSASDYNVGYYANTYGIIGSQHISPAGEVVNADTSENDRMDIVLDAGGQNYIEGYIRLPDGEIAPEGGLLISVGCVTVEMPQGASEVYYRSGVYYNPYLYCSVITENYSGTQFTGGHYITEGILSRYNNRMMIFDNLNENLTINLTLRLLQCVEGVISLSEPLIGGAKVLITIDGDANTYTKSLYMPEGETSIPYRVMLEESSGSQCHIGFRIAPDSEKYLTTSHSGEFYANETFTQYDVSDLTVERKAILISGNIYFPEGMNAVEDTEIFLYFENDYYSFSDSITIKKGENAGSYAIYVFSAETRDYAGEYTLAVDAYFLSSQRLYYSGLGLSFESDFKIAVENEMIVQNLVLPNPNSEIRGNIIMPVSAVSDIQVDIMIFSDYGDAIYKSIVILEGTEEQDFVINILVPNEYRDYKIGYKIENANSSTYYSGLYLYVSDYGFTTQEYESRIFDLYGHSEPFEVDIDLSGLKVSGYIKGEFILPDSYVIPDGKYFISNVNATNGEYNQMGSFRINAGNDRASYMIPVPEVYKSGEWTVSYSVGTIIMPPYEPAVPPSPGIPTGGGTVVTSYPPGMIIPENLLCDYKIYVAQNDTLSFYEQDARKFVFEDGGFDNIDIYAFSTNTPAPRIVGGFFTSSIEVPEEGVEVSVILQSIVDNEVLEQSFLFTGEAVRYVFETYGEKYYILKYNIGGEIFYYQNNYKLVADISLASTIKTVGIPAQYKKDVYYKNIYPASYYARVLNIREITVPIGSSWGAKIQVYNKDGVLLGEGNSYDTIKTLAAPIVIGYEIGGYKAYFTEYTSHLLSGYTTDFSKAAQIYLVPFYYYHAELDFIIPHIGFAKGIGTHADIENSYFDYSVNSENTISINRFFISAVNAEGSENEKVFIACYDKSEKLKIIKSFSLTSGDQFVDLNWIINKTDTVKVIGMGGNLNPLFGQLSFFGE